MKFPQSYINRIPAEYKREFIFAVCKENISKMFVISVLLTAVDPLLAVFTVPPESASFYLAIWTTLPGLVLILALYRCKKNFDMIPLPLIVLVQVLFLIGLLLGGTLWSLFEQSWISSYFLVVFTVAAFILMPPIVSGVMLLSFNLIFLLLLPQFQPEPDVISTLNVNTTTMSLVAWIMSHLSYRKGITSFINEKIIIEKNTELERKNMELSELTMRDSMTNLLNHKNSLRRLREEVERAKRINYPLAVAMVDLDNFKLVNDTYGHQTGDEVLIRVAQILADNCRSTDIIGRYGGEEFIIIMPDTDSRDAALLLERIQTIIEGTCFKDGIRITLSCGVSELNGESVHGILKSSDIMLYEAKKKGKNRVEVQINKEKKSAAIN